MHINLPLNLVGNGWLAPIAYCGQCIIDDREPRATPLWGGQAQDYMQCLAGQSGGFAAIHGARGCGLGGWL